MPTESRPDPDTDESTPGRQQRGDSPAPHAKSGEGAQSALAAMKRRMQDALPDAAADPSPQH